jgi:hypothetical protein
MSCIKKLLELKGDKEILHTSCDDVPVIEGGGVYHGYEYLITFTPAGHRCAYVSIPDRHIANDWNTYIDAEMKIECHGGITFVGKNHAVKEILGDDKRDDLWIGFDAAHYKDKGCLETIRRYYGNGELYQTQEKLAETQKKLGLLEFGEHRTYAFMEKECKDVIKQLIRLNENESGR